MQPQPQKKRGRAYRIDGSIVLYRLAARRQFKAERSAVGSEPWWGAVLGIPLFLRTLLRLVIACPHRHKGPPITLRESTPSHLPGRSDRYRGTYVTCLDCGQKFAYNHKTRRLVDFWGIHDAVARAEIRRKVAESFSVLRGFAAWIGRINLRIPRSGLIRSMPRHGIASPFVKSQDH